MRANWRRKLMIHWGGTVSAHVHLYWLINDLTCCDWFIEEWHAPCSKLGESFNLISLTVLAHFASLNALTL